MADYAIRVYNPGPIDTPFDTYGEAYDAAWAMCLETQGTVRLIDAGEVVAYFTPSDYEPGACDVEYVDDI